MTRRIGRVIVAVGLSAAPIALVGQSGGPGSFPPDWVFKGSALTGTQQVGAATWKAENGEIVGTPSSPDGGWLLLPSGYQDVQAGGYFKCAGDCKVGVMVRSEKTPEGTKGLYGVLAGGDRAVQAVTVDAQGKIGNVEALTRNAGGQYRLAPAVPAAGAADARGGGAGGRGGAGAPGAGGGRAGGGAPGGGGGRGGRG